MFVHTYQPNYKNYFVASFHSPVFNGQEIRQWCYNSFGPDNYRNDTDEVRWRDNIFYGEIYFQREEDLALFLLKWAS